MLYLVSLVLIFLSPPVFKDVEVEKVVGGKTRVEVYKIKPGQGQ